MFYSQNNDLSRAVNILSVSQTQAEIERSAHFTAKSEFPHPRVKKEVVLLDEGISIF